MIFKKELEEKLQDVKTSLENYNISVEDAYSELYNACMNYDYSLEDIFQDYIDYDTANEIARHELEEGGLYRLYYFMGDVNFGTAELMRIIDIEILKKYITTT